MAKETHKKNIKAAEMKNTEQTKNLNGLSNKRFHIKYPNYANENNL